MPKKKKTGSRERERISPRGDTRFVRRGEAGRFDQVVDAGRALAQDLLKKATNVVKAGLGDKGDTRRRAAKRTTARKTRTTVKKAGARKRRATFSQKRTRR